MPGTTILIFGATGDLARKKLIPALYTLYRNQRIGNPLIIGCSLLAVSVSALLDQVKPHITGFDEETWRAFCAIFYYQTVDFTNPADFSAFAGYVETLEQSRDGVYNRLAYLAVPADFFCLLTSTLGDSGLMRKQSQLTGVWHRLVYEKPFGCDLESARSINRCIARYFSDEQIYRIDHYLTKELVRNLLLMRFTNALFEPLWNNNGIEQIQIIVDEQEDILGRGAYYDAYGVLRDMVQNHIMQLIALIAMQQPASFDAEAIAHERLAVLRTVYPLDGLWGQYAGYSAEDGVALHSITPTFAALVLGIANPRWQGVPIYVRTGKAMSKKQTVIHIVFKATRCLIAPDCSVPQNYLTIRIDPEAGFTLHLNVKKPGALYDIVPVSMDFCHSCLYDAITPEPYEVILQEIMQGTHAVAVRFDEIEQAWSITQAIQEQHYSLYAYQKNSYGPAELDQFNQKHGIRWLS